MRNEINITFKYSSISSENIFHKKNPNKNKILNILIENFLLFTIPLQKSLKKKKTEIHWNFNHWFYPLKVISRWKRNIRIIYVLWWSRNFVKKQKIVRVIIFTIQKNKLSWTVHLSSHRKRKIDLTYTRHPPKFNETTRKVKLSPCVCTCLTRLRLHDIIHVT